MLVQRRRRWTNIEPAHGGRILFTRVYLKQDDMPIDINLKMAKILQSYTKIELALQSIGAEY